MRIKLNSKNGFVEHGAIIEETTLYAKVKVTIPGWVFPNAKTYNRCAWNISWDRNTLSLFKEIGGNRIVIACFDNGQWVSVEYLDIDGIIPMSKT
jgi:hypothetical protein